MDEQIVKAQKRIEAQIEGLRIPTEQKDRMKRVLKGIMTSPNGRLYFEKDNNFQKYLTLRKRDSADYDFCIVHKMIDEYSGATAGKKYDFPNLLDLAKLIDEYKDIMDSEIVNSENYQRVQKSQQQITASTSSDEKTLAEAYKKSIKNSIESIQNIPSYKKQRVFDVLDAISSSFTRSITSKTGVNYSEMIALRTIENELGYYIITRMFDEYSGATVGRKYRPVSARSLADYVDEHRTTLDKEIQKIRDHSSKSTHRPEEKSVSDDGWNR